LSAQALSFVEGNNQGRSRPTSEEISDLAQQLSTCRCAERNVRLTIGRIRLPFPANGDPEDPPTCRACTGESSTCCGPRAYRPWLIDTSWEILWRPTRRPMMTAGAAAALLAPTVKRAAAEPASRRRMAPRIVTWPPRMEGTTCGTAMRGTSQSKAAPGAHRAARRACQLPEPCLRPSGHPAIWSRCALRVRAPCSRCFSTQEVLARPRRHPRIAIACSTRPTRYDRVLAKTASPPG